MPVPYHRILSLDWLEILVEVVYERNASGDVELDDLVLRDVIEVLHQSSESIAVGSLGVKSQMQMKYNQRKGS